MSWNPRSVVDVDMYGDPFQTIDEGVDYLLNLAKEKGLEAQVEGNVQIQGVTRFAVSQVTQHHDLSILTFNLLLFSEKKRARASTTLLGKKSLDDLFSEASTGLASSPPNDFDQGLPDPKTGGVHDLGANSWSLEDRADTVVASVNAAEAVDDKVIVAGTASTSTTYSRIVNSNGIDVETGVSGNYFKVNSILGPPDARGYGQEELNWRNKVPNFARMAEEATRTGKDTLNLMTMDAKEYEVVLGQRAVTDLMNFIQFGTGPTGFHEGTSYTSDRLGDQIFDEQITIDDLPRSADKAFLCRLYDGEGLPTENRQFFDKGTLKFIPYDSFTAAKYLGDKSLATGNSGGGFFPGAFLGAAVMKTGTSSLEDQISEVKEGLYVKSFWYNRFTDPREGGLTGLTRNGLYLIKDGEISGAVRNLRYTESFVKALGPDNVVSVGNEQRMFFVNTVPSLHLRKYRFTSVAHTM